ncbi:EAL domain-containing protein [Priestia flexa]|jgi:EAL domain-containing protein (putative c-di-GMP-specific phosphodiesterase class I)|uniref:EAL domain-containing protein n=1 Tax=Priestia flexa TaxID=86664 RepID=A0A8I1MG79_9BACI|nr:EAL-associated domain-containing protein [Priestia flexa]MBN8252492.1 EAL domain-containing protein [Priestia flexa]MBN8433962.1 EAL domain-containing protein [Priestia flexa]MCA0966492.1 EAL domain-containing protein [Priestia flexa]RIV12103.1 EAL domain-containing protein [Priestia flexa]UIR31203.1 EAL domain-containing protein [Priestia flexa]
MDPLDVLTNIENTLPYYQAIFSADEHKIVGYEVLARIKQDDEIESLGAFFHDDAIPDEYRIEVDYAVLTKALNHILEQKEEFLIFINQNPNLLMNDHGESLLELLQYFETKGLSLNRVVLEITEHNFNGDIESLQHLLKYYQTYGIKVAIDNIGKESSNLDRIGLLSPDILKVDLHILRQTAMTQSYQDVLYSLSLLARKMGATLLYEDIEASYQLQYAWRNGGRYFQGFYLHKPSAELVDPFLLKDKLKNQFEMFIAHEKKKLQAIYELTESFQVKMQQLMSQCRKMEGYDEMLQYIASELSIACFRVYICDENGFQRSSNFLKKEHEWIAEPDYLHKNWSWRPYFLENIIRMTHEQRGILSDLYNDIETGENIRTFSYPIENGHYLFIDISYAFLYEKDAL